MNYSTILVAVAICFANLSSAFSQGEFKPVTVIPYAFPAIKNAKFVKASDSNNDVRAEELVLGVKIGSQPRAYPINMLTGPDREIINDKLGNQNIAVTW